MITMRRVTMMTATNSSTAIITTVMMISEVEDIVVEFGHGVISTSAINRLVGVVAEFVSFEV